VAVAFGELSFVEGLGVMRGVTMDNRNVRLIKQPMRKAQQVEQIRTPGDIIRSQTLCHETGLFRGRGIAWEVHQVEVNPSVRELEIMAWHW
jgi:hypothetical protein